MKRKHLTKHVVRNGVVLALAVAYTIYVYAFSTGITGKTKKNGTGCTCHGASATAGVVVTIVGPDTLQPSETAAYSVTISGGPAIAAGTNIAASGGTLNITEATLQKIGDELTHVEPLLFEGSTATFNFSYTAPAVEGAESLYANGNSVNNTGGAGGDQWNFSPNKVIIIHTPVVPPPPPPPFALDDTVNAGWNMVSLSLAVENRYKDSVFSHTTSSAFSFSGGTYFPQDSLVIGEGYWLRFDSSRIVQLDGQPVYKETINVKEGWNLVGSVSYPVAVESLQTDPPDIIVSSFFGFEGVYRSLLPSDPIKPAKAYWVNVSQAGQLFISHDSVIAKQAVMSNLYLNQFNSLMITDRARHAQTLYYGEHGLVTSSRNRYELPPKPPEGSFDVRFASQRFVEIIDQNRAQEFTIEISASSYPLTIEWNNRDEKTGARLSVDGELIVLRGRGSITLNHPDVAVSLINNPSEIPLTTALFQNYPNPFNPSTVIRYQLPVNSFVSLKIYNALGQEVQTLINEVQDAGYKSAEFNATNLPSGIYFYRLQAGSFTDVRKMAVMR